MYISAKRENQSTKSVNDSQGASETPGSRCEAVWPSGWYVRLILVKSAGMHKFKHYQKRCFHLEGNFHWVQKKKL